MFKYSDLLKFLSTLNSEELSKTPTVAINGEFFPVLRTRRVTSAESDVLDTDQIVMVVG